MFLSFVFGSASFASPVLMYGISGNRPVNPGHTTDAMKEVSFLSTPSLSYSLLSFSKTTNPTTPSPLLIKEGDFGYHAWFQ
jgi:hypothetical protein